MNEDNDDLPEMLRKCTNQIPKFSLEGETKLCKVVDVYDGDTCQVVFKHNNMMNRWSVRMTGYDSPEMRPSTKIVDRDAIKKKAIEAKIYLKEMIMNDGQLIYLKCGKFDKYGRLLGTLYINETDDMSINDVMIKTNHGYEYHGGKRK